MCEEGISGREFECMIGGVGERVGGGAGCNKISIAENKHLEIMMQM